MKGEFIRGDGLVLPNNLMTYGTASILQWAFQNQGYGLYMGLANCSPTPLLLAENTNEPEFGVGGYLRQRIPRGTGWPTAGEVNGEPYVESDEFLFDATDAWSHSVSRLMLINDSDARAGQLVVALSAPFGVDVEIDEDTPVELRTFKYRIYGR